jgi:hypothetical protein
MDTQREKREKIRQSMEYAVDGDTMMAASELLIQYRDDRIGLDLMETFYTCLPEARNDYIVEIRTVARGKGVFLLAAVTKSCAYLYMASSEGIEFHGAVELGYLDPDLLDFFGFVDLDDFKIRCESLENLPLYEPLQMDENICPGCNAVTGELHELGCPVERCPWCGGQLIHCPCRFERLEIDFLNSTVDLLRLEELLNEQGRVSYSPEQRPGFLDEGMGVVLE